MNKLIVLLFLLVGGLFLTNCSSSLVYSPSMNLPQRPLAEKEVDLNGGVELFPETRPESIESKEKNAFGFNGQLGYGFTNDFSMYAKGWLTYENVGYNRTGFALSGVINFPINENSRYMIIPRVGMALERNEINGFGASTMFVYQSNISEKFSFTSGGGLSWGYNDLYKKSTDNFELKFPFGYGLQGNVGLTYQIFENLRCNLEVNPLYQINTFDSKQNFVVAPNISLGYTFR